MKNRESFILGARIVLLSAFIWSIPGGYAHAKDNTEKAGDALAYLLPATAALATLGEKDREGTVQFAESYALAMGTTVALKYSVKEERPNKKDNYSFPSGHSASSFSSAEFIRVRYGWKYGAPAYVLATFVGYSRVHAKQHYRHDVIAGATIGIVSSHLLTTPYKGFQIQAYTDTKTYFIGMNRNW